MDRQDVPEVAGLAVGAYYDVPVNDLILRLKFHRLRAAVEAVAELVLAAGAAEAYGAAVVRH